MNVNENIPIFGRGRGKGRQLKVVPVQRTLMGPPIRPAPKRKEGSISAPTTSSSSNINWRSNQKSAQNNSTTVQTSTSSRSRSSSEPESRVVVALSQGRGEAIGEVGIAAINIARPSLILCQISDTQSYINTLTKINILNPSEILIPLTFIESFTSNRLIEKVKEQFRDVKITGVTRSTFNKTTGLQYVKQLCVPSMNSILLILQHRYYALAAAAALLTYTETILYVSYARESIKIEYQESEGSTIIDVATADRLELVASARPTIKKRYSCLLDVLNQCLTKIGARTLRASILQPPCSVPDIEARLNCVTELLEHSEMLVATQAVLSKLTNIDQLLTLATVLPDQAQSCSERQINYILLLNMVLEQTAPLHDIFENSQQPFFIELRATVGNPTFAEIKDLVRTLIHTDAHPGKGQNGTFQRCFAIKSGINSLLDLVRKSYSERLEDMRTSVKALGEKYSLALTLNNNDKKGYHIVLNLNVHQKKTLKKNDLPPECIQVERLANSYTMKTPDLITLSNRVEDIMAEILKMSNIMIHKLLVQIREHIGIFYKLCEDIAKLDMLQSLAKASSAMSYVRPQFADYLEVIQARHPLLDFLCSVEPIANSIYASKEYNMNIITGPNGSGKSIFIRQVVLIQVMAQVGCYVPAQSATLRVSDRILTRVYLEDNIDCGASAFVLEMKEIQYFLTVLTNNTLIIIDELCRSTSVEEGTALAMAVCEKLMKTSAFVYFTSHFKFMAKLQDLHFNVKTWQLETLTETINNQMILRFTYNVIPGVTSLEHYGIFLAKGSWPENIIKYAEDILRQLSKSHKRPSPHIEQLSVAARLKYDLEAELTLLKAKKQLTRMRINEKLMEYQRNLESFGHQVELVLVSDQMNNGDQLSVCENYNLGQTNSNFPLHQTGVTLDYYNLQDQYENSNINDISHSFSQIMANLPVGHPLPAQDRNIFQRLSNENEDSPQFLNFLNGNNQETEDCNFERQIMTNPPVHHPSSVQSRNIFGSLHFEHNNPPFFNFQNGNNQEMEDHNFERPIMANGPVDRPSSMQNRNIFENLHIKDKDHSEFLHFQNNQEMEDPNFEKPTNSFYQESPRFQPSNNFYQEMHFRNIPEFQRNSADLQEYPVDFSNLSDTLNNSAISYSKMFEPEVILETNEGLKLNYLNVQNVSAQQKSFVLQKKSMVVRQETTFVPQENSFTTSLHRNSIVVPENLTVTHINSSVPLEYSYVSKNLRLPKGNSVASRENSIVSRENHILYRETSVTSIENDSIYEDAASESFYVDDRSVNRGRNNFLEQPILNESKTNDESILSITEQQFSLPLQQNIERTSTPIIFDSKSHSQPLPVKWNQRAINYNNPEASTTITTNKHNIEKSTAFKTLKQSKLSSTSFDGINSNYGATNQDNSFHDVFATPTNIKTPKTNQQQHKSNSTTSDSIKWGPANQDNAFPTPTIFKTSNSHEKSNSTSSNGTKSNINSGNHQAANNSKFILTTDKNKKWNSSSNKTNSKTSTDSIIWNIEKKLAGNASDDVQKSMQNVSDSRAYSDADITEIINDLQSCSEYFSESQDWDHVDEEINLKLNQQANATKDCSRSDVIGKVNESGKAACGILKSDTKNHIMLEIEVGDDVNSENHGKYQEDSKNNEKDNKNYEEIQPELTESSRMHLINLTEEFNPDLETTKKANQSRNIEEKDEINQDENRNVYQCEEKTTYTVQRKRKPHFGNKNIQLKNCKRPSKSKIVRKIVKPQFTKKIMNPKAPSIATPKMEAQKDEKNILPEDDVAKASSWENNMKVQFDEEKHVWPTHTFERIVQPQSLREIHKKKSNEELHQSHQGEHPPQCSKEKLHNEKTSQPQVKENFLQEYLVEETSWAQENEKENVVPLGHSKTEDNLKNISSENKDFSSNACSNAPYLDPSNCITSKESPLKILNTEGNALQNNNHLNRQSQDEQMQIESHHDKDVNPKYGPSQNTSLEPLGDIHLELFSDESVFDESQNQPKEDCSSSKCLGSQCERGEIQKEICPIPIEASNSKMALDHSEGMPGSSKLCRDPQRDINIMTDEYETAHSVLASSQQDSIFFNTPLSIEEASTSTPDNGKRQQTQTNSAQKPKRRRLGYVTKNLDKPILNNSEQYSSPILEISENQPDVNKENSPDVFEDKQEVLLATTSASEQLSLTPSDFESSQKTMSKSKRISFFKTSSQSTDTSNERKRVLDKKSKMAKFKPPWKLTKKELELAFYEQDKKLLESGNSSQYLDQIVNRPSVKQIRQTKHIASIHKTSSGVVVVPIREKKPQKRKQKFVPPLKKRSEEFDVTLFSDKNSDKFEQFMNNNNPKKIINVRQDVANQYIKSEVVTKTNSNKENVSRKNSDGHSSDKIIKDVQKRKVKILQNIQLVVSPSTVPKGEDVEHPQKGYYTQNKNRIDNIVDKYLNPQVECANMVMEAAASNSQKKISQEYNSSIFSQSTVLLDLDDD